ncbi:MAG: A/G-specific adenine glycosylase [Spirochaetaceae bacterium]|nr:A/G-specific adenine glycosylase [Spirochaetaceae bacterium]
MKKNISSKQLLAWFDCHKKQYPWGENKLPYTVWISEIMLQQTVATSVVPYFKQWITDYPDIQALASCEPEEVLRHWEGLGYYSRCRNLHKAAKAIMERFNGILPDSYSPLISLPGIGDYTARAILSIAYGKPYAVLDANVRRIVQRFTATMEWDKDLDKETLTELEKIIPHHRPGDFNEAMMQLGQLVCTTGSPRCGICPIGAECLGYKTGLAEMIPQKQKKRINREHKTALLFFSNCKILLRQKKKGLFHDLWLIPTTEKNNLEKIRAIDGEWTGINSISLTERNHFYTDNQDILTPLLITTDQIDLSDMTPEDNELYRYQWVAIEDLNNLPSPSVYRKILNEAKGYL